MPKISTIFFRLAGVRLTFSIQVPPTAAAVKRGKCGK